MVEYQEDLSKLFGYDVYNAMNYYEFNAGRLPENNYIYNKKNDKFYKLSLGEVLSYPYDYYSHHNGYATHAGLYNLTKYDMSSAFRNDRLKAMKYLKKNPHEYNSHLYILNNINGNKKYYAFKFEIKIKEITQINEMMKKTKEDYMVLSQIKPVDFSNKQIYRPKNIIIEDPSLAHAAAGAVGQSGRGRKSRRKRTKSHSGKKIINKTKSKRRKVRKSKMRKRTSKRKSKRKSKRR